MPSKDAIRKLAIRVAVDVALYGAILVTLITIRSSVLKQWAGQLFNGVEPQLLPDTGFSQCPESESRSSSSLHTCTVIVGSFVYYALIFVVISTSRDEMKQVLQAFLRIIIKGGLFLALAVVEYARRSLCVAAYSVKTLRARLEAISRYLEFSPCLGVTTRLFLPESLKTAITCLFFFGLGVVVTIAYHHFKSLSTYAHVASGGLSHLASDFNNHAETLFFTIAKSESVLATVLFSLGLRFLVRSILSFSTLKEAQKVGQSVALLFNNEERQDSTIFVEDKSFAESDKDTLCGDDETYNLNMGGDDCEDESEKNVSSLGQEALSIATPIANGDKEDGHKQRLKVSIISNSKEDLKHLAHIPSFCASVSRSISLRQQQAEKLNSNPSSLSAFTPEFVPQFRNTAAVCGDDQGYYPPHWTAASPVSVRITAPAKRHRFDETHLQPNVENGDVL